MHSNNHNYNMQHDHQHFGHDMQPAGNAFQAEPNKPVKTFSRPSWHMQLVTYGARSAFQMETSQSKDGWMTVTVESASKEDPSNPANLRYLWKNKNILQIGRNELPLFIGVFLGLLPGVRFDNHGDDLKFLEIINQDKHFFIKCGGKGLPLHVAPIPLVEAYMYGTLGLAQYTRNFEGLSTEASLQIITRLCGQLYANGAFKQPEQRQKQ